MLAATNVLHCTSLSATDAESATSLTSTTRDMTTPSPARNPHKLVSLWKGTTRAVVALKPKKALRFLRVGDEKRLIARAACETLIDLVRDSGDVFPPLKAAAGGIANVLKQLRVRVATSSKPGEQLMNSIRPWKVTPKLSWNFNGAYSASENRLLCNSSVAKTSLGTWKSSEGPRSWSRTIFQSMN